MDLFKNFKDLHNYCNELSSLLVSITAEGAKVKVGKFKVVNTPSKEMAEKLSEKLRAAVGAERTDMVDTYSRIETILEEAQTNLFHTDKDKKNEQAVAFSSKVK